jgi:hypothetical protein
MRVDYFRRRGTGVLRQRLSGGVFALLLLGTAAAASDPSANTKPQAVFLIQTGAFKSDEKARQHCDRLAAAGFPLKVTKATNGTADRSVWFFCRSVDAFERERASEIVASLKSDAGVAEAILLPVTLRAAKSGTAEPPPPNDLRAQFEKFMSERESRPVELFEEFMRRQGRPSN